MRSKANAISLPSPNQVIKVVSPIPMATKVSHFAA